MKLIRTGALIEGRTDGSADIIIFSLCSVIYILIFIRMRITLEVSRCVFKMINVGSYRRTIAQKKLTTIVHFILAE